jgi:CheY-like chemotaxis protein
MELFQPNECLILIVDDVPNNLRLLDEILDEMSYNTIFANSGK